MGRRAGLPSALFPFMSVLACTIGALVVLLAVIALAAVDTTETSRERDKARGEALAQARADLEGEASLLARVSARWEEVDRALSAAGIEPGEELDTLFAAIRTARREDETLKALAEARAEAAALAEERGEVEVTLSVLESRREALPILIDPTDLSERWHPFFIECEEAGITAIRARDDLRRFIPRDALGSEGDLGRYLRRVRSEPGALLVLLVRPDGLQTSKRTATLARSAGLRVARLPIPAGGDLDWQLLRRSEGAG